MAYSESFAVVCFKLRPEFVRIDKKKLRRCHQKSQKTSQDFERRPTFNSVININFISRIVGKCKSSEQIQPRSSAVKDGTTSSRLKIITGIVIGRNQQFTCESTAISSASGSMNIFVPIQSASSLLLSVANLENFTKLQEKSSRALQHGHEWVNQSEITAATAQQSQNHLVLNITENGAIHHQPKAKDSDQVSIASSTHFTVVNGFGRSNIKTKSNSICRQGRQLTILIVTMSVLFMIGIIAAIYLMDSK